MERVVECPIAWPSSIATPTSMRQDWYRNRIKLQVWKVPATVISNRLNSASEVNVDAHCARLSNWGFPKSDLKSLAMAKKVKSLAYNRKN